MISYLYYCRCGRRWKAYSEMLTYEKVVFRLCFSIRTEVTTWSWRRKIKINYRTNFFSRRDYYVTCYALCVTRDNEVNHYIWIFWLYNTWAANKILAFDAKISLKWLYRKILSFILYLMYECTLCICCWYWYWYTNLFHMCNCNYIAIPSRIEIFRWPTIKINLSAVILRLIEFIVIFSIEG